VLFGEFLLAFHLVGVLLLTGVIGAVALVQRRAETAHGLPPRRPIDDGLAAREPGRALGSGGRS
jgi:hypothetical protein